jgi:hypothetical protein
MATTPITLTGSIATSGVLTPVVITNTSLPLTGSVATAGSIALSAVNLPGAFADFGVVPFKATAYYDPAMAYVSSQSIRPATPDGTTPGWFRASITAAGPVGYTPGPAGRLWSRAAFARVGLVSNSASAATAYSFDRAQMEPTTTGNLLTAEQSSYEGRMCYTTATTAVSYTKSADIAVSGAYSGKYFYQQPAASNSYQLVTSYGRYQHALDVRQSYSLLLTNPPFPSEQEVPTAPPVGGGLTTFTVSPNLFGLVPVVGGTSVIAQVSIATRIAGLTLRCQVLRYDSSYNTLSTSTVTYGDLTSVGNLRWQSPTARLTLESACAYVAVVPLVTAGSAQTSMTFYVDQHRLYRPTTISPTVFPNSPAQAWQEPHTMIVKVKADRVNYATNPAFTAGVGGWSAKVTAGLTNTLTTKTVTGYDGTGTTVLSHAIPTVPTSSLIADGWYGVQTAGMLSGPTGNTIVITGLQPRATYTASAWVQPIVGQVPVTCWFFDGAQYVRGTRTTYVGAGVARTWQRLAVTFTTDGTFSGDGIFQLGWASQDMAFVYRDAPPSDVEPEHWVRTTAATTRGPWVAGTSYSTADIVSDSAGQNWYAQLPSGARTTVGGWEMWVDNILVETGTQLRPYFDGNTPGLEYLWENGTVNARSHYYRGLDALRYRLDQAVGRYLPQGAPYQILYAAAP